MKNIVVLFLFFSGVSFAQNTTKVCHKIAHVDVEYVLSVWHKVKEVDSIVYGEKAEYERQFQSTYKEYLDLEELMSKKKYTEELYIEKEKELNQLKQKVQQFSFDVKNRLANRQNKLMKPLLAQVKLAIDQLAFEGDYDYVLSSTTGSTSLILFCKNSGDDITDQLLKKIGVK